MSVDLLGWFEGLTKHIKLVVLATAVVIWLAIVEPVFGAISFLSKFDWVIDSRVPYGAQGLHAAIALLIAMGLREVCRLCFVAWKKAQDINESMAPLLLLDGHEKLVMRVFIDAGYREMSTQFFGEKLRPMAKAANADEAEMAQACRRLQERELLWHKEAGLYYRDSGWALPPSVFALLSSKPSLVNSTSPRRLSKS